MPRHYRQLQHVVPLLVLSTAFFVSSASASFNFSWTEPTQCDNFTVTWQGGIGPYHLLFAPKYKVPLNFSIPDNVYDSTKDRGSFSLTLNTSSQSVFLLIMSDSTGFASGGVSPQLTVGNSIGGQCNSTDLKPAFTYDTPLSLQQCRTYEFSGYDAATLPVTIYGFIPSGDAFILRPPNNSTQYNWTTNVAAGTALMFTMIDSAGRPGGSSDIVGTGLSQDTSCLNSSSPQSTTRASTQTQTSSQPSSETSTSTHPSGGSSGHSNAAVIGGSVGGVIAALGCLAFLFWFYNRRQEASKRRSGTAGLPERKRGGPIDLLQDGRDAPAHYPLNPATALEGSPGEYEPVPYVLPPSRMTSSGRGESLDGSDMQYASYRGSGAAGNSTVYSKTSEALLSNSSTNNTPTRFILHTDGGSVMGSDEGDEEDEIVELPPQYDSLGHIIPQRQVSRRLRRSQRRPTTENEEIASTPPLPQPQATDSSQSPES